MYRAINEQERIWLKYLLEADLSYKEILAQQIKKAKVSCNYNDELISVKFSINANEPLYPVDVRVPIEMRAWQKNMEPIQFLLHVINGYIDELEIFCASGAPFDKNNIILDDLTYEVNPLVKL